MCGAHLLGVLAWSCAADSAAPEEPAKSMIELPACTPLAGVYRVSYSKRTGDCADLPEQLAQFADRTNASALSPSCISAVETSVDGCDRQEDGICPVNDDTGTSIGQARLATMLSSSDDTHLEGTASISLTTFDGTGCTATYAVSGVKIE
jgi:hypothetical protein